MNLDLITPDPLANLSLIQRVGALLLRVAQLVGDAMVRDRSAARRVRVEAIQARVFGFSRRLRALLRAIEAGTLPAPRPRRATPPVDREATTPAARPAPADAPIGLPRRFGWLMLEVATDHRHQIAIAALGLERMLTAPETLAKLAQAPGRAGRIVRPMFHALGLAVPEPMRLPPRLPRVRAPRPPAPRVPPPPWRRVASAEWPKGCVRPGELIPLRKRRRREE